MLSNNMAKMGVTKITLCHSECQKDDILYMEKLYKNFQVFNGTKSVAVVPMYILS